MCGNYGVHLAWRYDNSIAERVVSEKYQVVLTWHNTHKYSIKKLYKVVG